jgi:adenylate cyclase
MTEIQSDQRKLAAILAADVAGYSRLMGMDEEGTAHRLQAVLAEIVHPAVAANQGRVVKTTGDGMLVEFASVVNATRAALAVQQGMAAHNAPEAVDGRIEFRIGIHLGDVLVQPDGDLLGDGVNIAARLEGICEPGGICLSQDAVHQVQGKVDATFADAGPQNLKNIAHPVRVFTATAGTASRPKPARLSVQEPRRRRSPLRLAIIFGGIALIVVAGRAASWLFQTDHSPPAPAASAPLPAAPTSAPQPAREPPRFSVVVLPFSNLSGDPSQDYFADGITENLTTDLSRARGMFVIARNTSFTYKGKSVDAKAIGAELNVRYVLEGSVQRDQNRVRVNAQLIDAASGAHIWADRFDEARADLFKLQDEIVARLANGLGYELNKAETERSLNEQSRNPDSVDLVLRGAAILHQSAAGSDKEKVAQARTLFQEALKLDPNNLDALLHSAWTDFQDVAYGRADPAIDQKQRCMDSLDRVLTIDPDFAQAYAAKAMLLMVTRRTGEAAALAEKAIALDPNDPTGYGALAWAQTLTGHDQEALANLDQAVSLSPRDPSLGFWLYLRGGALVDLKRYDEAVAAEQAAIGAQFTGWPAYLTLAVAYAIKGDQDQASAALAEVRKMNPNLSIRSLHESIDLPEGYWDGLRKAGLPEG